MGRLKIAYLALRPTPKLKLQAEYALLSALAYAHPAVTVHLFTDAPESFAAYSDAITLEPIERVPAASGANAFSAKLRVVEHLSRGFPEDCVMFVDADTFFVHPYAPIHDLLAKGVPLLHRREYLLASEATGQARKFRRALRHAGMAAESRDWMWNSGVIGLPPGYSRYVTNALERMTALTAFTPKHAYLAEQFSMSTAVPSPQPAEDFVFHYWYQKAEYTAAIEKRLAAWRTLPLAERKQAFLQEDRLRLPAPPQKLHWWERLLIRGGRRKPTDPRGMPR